MISETMYLCFCLLSDVLIVLPMKIGIIPMNPKRVRGFPWCRVRSIIIRINPHHGNLLSRDCREDIKQPPEAPLDMEEDNLHPAAPI